MWLSALLTQQHDPLTGSVTHSHPTVRSTKTGWRRKSFKRESCAAPAEPRTRDHRQQKKMKRRGGEITHHQIPGLNGDGAARGGIKGDGGVEINLAVTPVEERAVPTDAVIQQDGSQ